MEFVAKHYGEWEGVSSDTITYDFFGATDCFFSRQKKLHEQCQFETIYFSNYVWKRKKTVDPSFYQNLTSSIYCIYCRSNVNSHAGCSIFLCHLSENDCSEHVSENFRNVDIFLSTKIFRGY